MDKKGVSRNAWILIFACVALSAILVSFLAVQPEKVTLPEEVTYEAGFTGVGLPEEMTGDLQEARLRDTTGERPSGSGPRNVQYNITSCEGSTCYVQLDNTPMVEDASLTTVYVNGSDISGDDTINWSFQNADNSNLSVTLGAEVCNISKTQCNVTCDYRYQSSEDAYNETDNEFTAELLTDEKISEGDNLELAYRFDIDKKAEGMEISGDRETSDFDIEEAYIVKDSEDVSMEKGDAVWEATTLENDEFEFDIDERILEKNYVLVIEIDSTEDIGSGVGLFDPIDMSIETEGDVDTGTVTIYRKAGSD